ncbi:MAG: hypothetical protein IMF09_03810 [Proteobacteria bacterium]|nr:hypothetical protein [Pseudomonadota bacterium]
MSLFQHSKFSILIISLVFGIFTSAQVFAKDDPSESCASAAELFSEGDIEGALEEARWCVTQLEQLKKNETSAYFKDEIDGYEGGKLNSQQAMGITVIERSYSKGSEMINVSLTGGSSGGLNSAFAAMAAMGMQAAQGEKVRIQRRSALVTDEGDSTSVVVTLKSGGMLTFESSEVSNDDLVAFAKEFPVADLDDSIN